MSRSSRGEIRVIVAEILGALGRPGPIEGPGAAASIGVFSVDSRTVEAGGGFAALVGERVDGHRYVGRAIENGAAVALVSRPVEDLATVRLNDTAPIPDPPLQIVVDDVLKALQRMANWLRVGRPDLRVVGVTGSVGKTTTKDAVAEVLGQRYATLKNAGNRNNEIGLPLTLSAMQPEHQVAVLEMGMYDLGEIALLCEIARPQVGVVTNVGPTHLERLGTIERIAQAKAELVQALPSDGIAVLNGDDERVAAMATVSQAPCVTYGLEADELVFCASDIESQGLEGITFAVREERRADLGLEGGTRSLHCRMIGEHAIWPSLAAVAVGRLLGLNWEEIERGLLAVGPGPRLVPREARAGVLVLDDSYNASPASGHAALDALAQLEGRKVAILGDMLELGALEEAGHLAVGRQCAQAADRLLAVGERARAIVRGALEAGMPEENASWVADGDEALAALDALIESGDVVLVKASRGIALERLVRHLLGEQGDA